jgi:hypothetical protein
MVMMETEAVKKKELMAVCSMCELPVPDAKSCYTDPVDFTFLCIHCFHNIPTIKEMETLIEKIRHNQKYWTDKKAKYVSFLSLQPDNGNPIPPTSITEVDLETGQY